MFAESSLRSVSAGRRGRDRLVYLLCMAAGAIALLPLVLVLLYLLVEGLKAWSPAFLVSPPGGVRRPGHYGFMHLRPSQSTSWRLRCRFF